MNDFLPIGSVVLLKNSPNMIMIIGYLMSSINGEKDNRQYDYCGCMYPNGMSKDNYYMFNRKAILKVYFKGYTDEAGIKVLNDISKINGDDKK